MKICVLGLIFLSMVQAWANPEPEIPITITADASGNSCVTVEIDPRCFTEDPMRERYLMKVDLLRQPGAFLVGTKQQAVQSIAQWIIFDAMVGSSKVQPKFETTFRGIDNAPLKKPDDPVVVRCRWTAKLSTLQVHAGKKCPYAVVVTHDASKTNVTLFPGEKSPRLTLDAGFK
ncbi:MAG: hypothetical protein JNJ83_22790 [Verrucomicrobiaceae bacterium]|nr:hypothetical protein [Verrucomicrobiaceae bacterium]